MFVCLTNEQLNPAKSASVSVNTPAPTAMCWLEVRKFNGLTMSDSDARDDYWYLVYFTLTSYEGMLRYLQSIANEPLLYASIFRSG